MEASVSKDPTGNILKPPRDLSLDFLKGVSIILVVFFHNLQLNPDSILDNIFMMWGNVAVPAFFLVSGALFFTRPFSWKHHIQHILRFYLALTGWKTVYLVIYHLGGVPVPVSKRELLTYLLLFGDINGIATGHLWFIVAMLTVLLAAPILRICMEQDRKLTIYLMATCFFFNQLLTDANLISTSLARLLGKGAWDLSVFGEINPFSFRYSNYMFYYMLGAFLQKKKNEKTISPKTGVFMTAAGILGLVLIKYLQSGTFRWQSTHLVSGYYWISTVLAASGMFLSAAHIPFHSSRLLMGFSKIVGTSTLGIFYLHMPLIFVLTPRLFIRIAAYNGWVVNLLESLFMVAISCMIVWTGRKLPVIRYLF